MDQMEFLRRCSAMRSDVDAMSLVQVIMYTMWIMLLCLRRLMNWVAGLIPEDERIHEVERTDQATGEETAGNNESAVEMTAGAQSHQESAYDSTVTEGSEGSESEEDGSVQVVGIMVSAENVTVEGRSVGDSVAEVCMRGGETGGSTRGGVEGSLPGLDAEEGSKSGGRRE
ncbi:hypothetical protein R1sor_006720 [Riccia sorocarpa]|uniref:Uncharacterized protein n=1 Tax=Riccia sorocarpa TaxID=122646 RepID=A0ABD3HRB2_9MARC